MEMPWDELCTTNDEDSAELEGATMEDAVEDGAGILDDTDET